MMKRRTRKGQVFRVNAASHAPSTDQRRVQGDLGVQQLRDWAARLRLVGKLLKFCIVRTRDLGFQDQMDGRDREAVGLLFKRHVGLGLHMLGGELRFAENERQRHREAAGMRRADQFFRIGPRLALEAAGKAIGIILERTAFGRDGALAILDSARPDRRSVRTHMYSPGSATKYRVRYRPTFPK